MAILLFGCRGMLGRDLISELVESSYATVGIDKEEIDVTNRHEVLKIVQTLKPDIIINATGYTDVDGAENHHQAAFNLNEMAVKYLVEASVAVGAKFFHFSTEMVFGGKNQTGYSEIDLPQPINVYGQSKAAGEKYVLAYKLGFLIRTSWLYGRAPQRGKPRGMNFIETMLQLAEVQHEVRVVKDQYGKPTASRDLAAAVVELIRGNWRPGVYHLVNEGVASWYDVAKEIWRLRHLSTPLTAITSAEYRLAAVRPSWGVLVNTKFPHLRVWQKALVDYLSSSK